MEFVLGFIAGGIFGFLAMAIIAGGSRSDK